MADTVAAIPDPLPAEGWVVPLRAAFTGFKRFPLLAIAHNNAHPHLALFDDRLECRVLRARSRPITVIESIDIVQARGTNNLRVLWRDSSWAFVANVRTEDLLRELVAFFHRKGVGLSDRAARLLAT